MDRIRPKMDTTYNFQSNLKEQSRKFKYIFVGREHQMQMIEGILCSRDKQGVVLTACGGTGKSRLAYEIGLRLELKYGYKVRWLDAETSTKFQNDFIAFYKEISNQTINASEIALAITRINSQLDLLEDFKLLLILDNVEELIHAQLTDEQTNEINPIGKALSDFSSKCKFILTSRDSSIVENVSDNVAFEGKFEKREIAMFSSKDVGEYLEKNLKPRKDIGEERRKQIYDLLCQSHSESQTRENSHHILPIQLFLTVTYINEHSLTDFKTLLKDLTSGKVLLAGIEFWLFKKLTSSKADEKSHLAFQLLLYCAYLDADFIWYNLLERIVKLKLAVSLDNVLPYLTKSGLVNNIESDRCIKLHRLIQEQVIKYAQAYIGLYDSEFKILWTLANILLDSDLVKEIVHTDAIINEMDDEITTCYLQVSCVIEQIRKIIQSQVTTEKAKKIEEFQLDTLYMRLRLKYADYNLYKEHAYEKARLLYSEVYDEIKKTQRDSLIDKSGSEIEGRVGGLNDKQTEMLMRASLGLASSHMEMGELLKALEFCQKSHENIHKLSLNDIVKQEAYKSRVYFSLGMTYLRLEKEEKARYFLEEAYKLRKGHGGEEERGYFELAQSLDALALVRQNQGENANEDENKKSHIETALKYRTQAYKIKKRIYSNSGIKDHASLAASLKSQAFLNGLLVSFKKPDDLSDDVDAELRLHMEAYEMLCRLHPNSVAHEDVADSLDSLARIMSRKCLQINEVEYRIKCYEMLKKLYVPKKATKTDEKTPVDQGEDDSKIDSSLEKLIGATRSLAIACTELGLLEKALDYNLEAHKLRQSANARSDMNLQVEAICAVGETYFFLQNYPEAIHWFLKVEEKKDNLDSGHHCIKNTYEAFTFIYKHLKDQIVEESDEALYVEYEQKEKRYRELFVKCN